MAKQSYQLKYVVNGVSDYIKDTKIADTLYFAQAIDYRTDPQALTLLPAAVKESGGNVTDLLKCADTVPGDLSVYSYGNAGNIYKRTSSGTWSKLRTVSTSHGNGMGYYTGDDYLYYASDKLVGRYGPLAGTPSFTDDFLGAQGGVPTNTNSLLLASASSMYAHAADSATLSITGDLTLETFFKANTLPTAGNSMTLVGKWDESGVLRSYMLDLYGVSGYFGDGSDGALTISSNTTEAPIDSTATGTAGAQSLTATNASFAAGQVILIHQTQGTGAGKWERNTIQGYTAGTITTGTALVNSYTTGAQVRVLKQYSAVTINTGITYTAKAWTGSVGGIIGWLCSGTTTVTGTISANGKGFRGYSGTGASAQGKIGEGQLGANGGQGTGPSVDAGGNGGREVVGGVYPGGGGGGQGAYADQGTDGSNPNSQQGTKGLTYGSADITTGSFGGAGGSGGGSSALDNTSTGGNGGGFVFITAVTTTITGSIVSNGSAGTNGATSQAGGGGGGAGGSVLIKAQVATLGSSLITATGGAGGAGSGNGGNGGTGGVGRIHLDYYTSFTGTTSPTLDSTQDTSLVTTVTPQARLSISNDGTAFERLTMNLSTLTTGVWNRLSVSWVASTSTATFYLNAVSLGTFVGTKTAIHDNTSLLYVGANKGASAIQNYFDGYLNDMRIWSNAQSSSQIFTNNLTQVATNSAGLNAYYKFNNSYADATANANTLTAVNTPTFPADVPFSGATTRLDIDQSYTTTGSTSAVNTAIVESAAEQVVFIPTLDPQKSIDVNISAKGTGNWTVTVHDTQNNTIATATTANASLPASGYYEFVFSTPWRIVIGKTYHFHITSTVNDGVTVSSSLNNISTSDWHTYYGFLVTDTQWHPIIPMLNKMLIGNERYIATWDGASYNANFIAFPPQTHVRCFAYWREYVAIGTWREVSSGTPNIYDWPAGRIYFWDGISLTFNFWVDIPEGQINALVGNNNILYIFAGWKGDLLAYQGGYSTLSTSASKVKRLPMQARADYLEIYPGAACMWRSLLYFGASANSNSTTILKGAYSWGTLNRLYDESLSLDFPISTGNTGSTVSIGLVYPIGQTLLIGWQDGAGYGVDQVSFSNNPASYGQIQSLIQDGGMLYKQDSYLVLRADHKALASGESIKLKYSLDRGSFITGNANSTTNSKYTALPISGGRVREIQYGVELRTTGTTSPTLLATSALWDSLEEEQQFG